MYQKNNLGRDVLILSNEVIYHGPTSHTADARQIEQAIIIAEERFIKKAICKDLYEAFRTAKNKLLSVAEHGFFPGDTVNAIEYVTDEWMKKLWFEYLWKICAECVIYTATPTNFSEFTSQGEMINNPKSILNEGQGAVSATHKEVTWKMDKLLMDRIDPLLAAMHEWICDNKSNFPLYNCKPCACTENGVSSARKTGWINVYNNTGNLDGCCKDD